MLGSANEELSTEKSNMMITARNPKQSSERRGGREGMGHGGSEEDVKRRGGYSPRDNNQGGGD